MTSTKVILTNPHQTVDAQPDGTVLIIFRGKYNGESFDEVDVVLTYRGYLDLLAELANHARHGVLDILGDLATGPCELCKNRRLIDYETTSGHKTNRHCDCMDSRRNVDEMISEATFPMRDTHHAYDGKMTFEVEVDGGG